MHSLERSAAEQSPMPSRRGTEESLIEAFLARIPIEHRGAVRERLLRTDVVISAQSKDTEGQALLDRLYELRGVARE